MELIRTHPTWMSGRSTGHVPFRVDGPLARLGVLRVLFRLVFHRILTVNTPLGRKARTKMISGGGPLIRVKPWDMAVAGIVRVPRMRGVRDGLPLLEDGSVLDVANVIWCTGFQPGFSWIDLPLAGPIDDAHKSGVVTGHPGLYFVGLHFLRAASSVMIHGVGSDAERIAKTIDSRVRSPRPAHPGQKRATVAAGHAPA
jgi:putative flavoprotein involved in K+ transport